MTGIKNVEGSFDDDLDVRIELVEAKFENKSANVSDVVVGVVDVGGETVPTEAWSIEMTDKVNAIKDCLVDHELMEPAE